MKIAVASQNRKTVTGHAGKCRKFWIYEIEHDAVSTRTLLELPIDQSFHASHGQPHPLDDVQVLITGGMGMGLKNRLAQKSIVALSTSETDPDSAVKAWLNGTLDELPPEPHHRHGHAHTHQG